MCSYHNFLKSNVRGTNKQILPLITKDPPSPHPSHPIAQQDQGLYGESGRRKARQGHRKERSNPAKNGGGVRVGEGGKKKGGEGGEKRQREGKGEKDRGAGKGEGGGRRDRVEEEGV